MPDLICDTSVIQYLHQTDLLHILPAPAERIIIPPAVRAEITAGLALGIDLPDLDSLSWLEEVQPKSAAALPLVADLGPGEIQVLMLALENPGAVVVLDDGLARLVAAGLDLPFTGMLGLLLDAKTAALIATVRPILDRLETLRFRLSPQTRRDVLRLAGEDV